MKLDEKTFGATPAAMYLVRTLNEIGNPGLSRSTGKRITATTSMVTELVEAYEIGWINAKVLANTMRLMREEIANEWTAANKLVFETGEEAKTLRTLVDKLRRNVQIGYIKKAIRQATVARKCETVMTAPLRKGIHFSTVNGKKEIAYFDKQLDKMVHAGWLYHDGVTAVTCPIYLEEVDTITPQLLHERSLKRCKRLGKPHAI